MTAFGIDTGLTVSLPSESTCAPAGFDELPMKIPVHVAPAGKINVRY
jgi:hypothetical protein